jgi:hypothetical protein
VTWRIEARAAFANPSATTLVLSAKFMLNTAAPGTYATVTACTVGIVDEDGATVLSPTATTTGTEPTLSVAMPASLDVGKIYRATWIPTIGGSAQRAMTVPLYAIGFDARDCPVTSNDVIAAHPTLNVYPSGLVSWENVIQSAWDRVLMRLVRTEMLRKSVWSVLQLRQVTLLASLAAIFRQGATYTGGPALEMAEHYEGLFDDEWRTLRLDVDTDGDGDVDTVTQPLATPTFPGTRPATR